jgi:hypothetical protein
VIGHGGEEIATPRLAIWSKIDVVHNRVVDVKFWLVLLASDLPHSIQRDPFGNFYDGACEHNGTRLQHRLDVLTEAFESPWPWAAIILKEMASFQLA